MCLEDGADVSVVLGSPKEVARDIIANCTEKHFEKHKKKGGMKNTATLIWLIILGICASPIAIPIGIALLAVVGAVLLTVGCVMLTLLIAGFSIVLFGVCCFLLPVVAMGTAVRLQCIGLALICVSLGILFCLGIVKISQLFIRLFVKAIFQLPFSNKYGKGV